VEVFKPYLGGSHFGKNGGFTYGGGGEFTGLRVRNVGLSFIPGGRETKGKGLVSAREFVAACWGSTLGGKITNFLLKDGCDKKNVLGKHSTLKKE